MRLGADKAIQWCCDWTEGLLPFNLRHIFIKVFCATWLQKLMWSCHAELHADFSEVALFVGHAYSTNEAKDDE